MNHFHTQQNQFLLRRLHRQTALRAMFLLCFAATSMLLFAQQTIRGKITGEGGTAIPGATVQVKGTATATQTDAGGQFTITAPGNATLVVSSVGFEPQEIKVNNRSSVNVEMRSTSAELQQVVVVGYGTQRKATLTGSVTAVKGSEITKSPTINVSNSLAGRLPGLVTVTPSGEPGYDGTVLRIRGINTLGNNDPLVVVDGVPGRSLERLDPNTIESITVLKDASAAIYGAQAANGVILVTTKRGKVGKPTITASFNQAYSRPTRLPKMADAATYAIMLNEINDYAGRAPKFSNEEIQKYRSGVDPWRYPNTDWFSEVLRPWSGQNQANVSINGGSEAMRYFVSLTKRSQEGFYYNSGTKFGQYDLRTNLDGNINKNISFGFDVAGRMEDRNFPTRSAGSIFRMVMRGKPNEIAYWPNGLPGPDIEYGDNPVVVSTKATGYDHDKRYVVNTNGRINIKVPQVPGLSLTGNAAIDKTFQFHKLWQTPWTLYSWDGTTVDQAGNPVVKPASKGFASPALTEEMNDRQNILLNGLVNYEHRFAGGHNGKILFGAERISGNGDYFSAYRRNFQTAVIDQLSFGAQDQFMSNSGTAYHQARLNYFGRVNYDFREKFLAEFVWRYQASYIFEKSHRWGFFPGVSLGYKISNEDFFRNNVSFINDLKLRASWGRTGNDQIPEWNYLTTYAEGGMRAQSWNPPLPFITNGSTENKTLYEVQVPNPMATWESADQRNVGFDAQLLKGRLSVTADYFVYKRSDILIKRRNSIPGTAGFEAPAENIGKTSNRGFDFSINYNNNAGKLSYTVGFNGGYQKNRIDFWDEADGVPANQKTTGYPIGSSLYYKAIGIFHTQADVEKYPHWSNARPGDVIFEDLSGPDGKPDGKIDGWDRIRIYRSDIPRFTGGITGNLQYLGFELSLLIQGAAGAVRYISTESGEIGNFLQSFAENRWTKDNPNASGPRTFNRGNEYWVGQGNTNWLQSTDYIRLKNIELGYNLPASLLSKAGMQGLRVYVNAYNLLTYSPKFKDFDPELGTGSGQGYPLQKTINLGASVTF
ncbi:SusC/RagA family TonB-linked outer membrane protein [Flavisolibacter nicotianae]|uniref:SusC/RagA family TonB-linked outer membrane protein n=1 Tax=Flavisolibacter nicotianae TaxID=2364882 RepID=UPI001F093E45|nr:TonB-dependent receptor [Flavisolibacter nicotianae]